eukprot:scaffold6813_cov123-Isochrysis_galbana.AAC.13
MRGDYAEMDTVLGGVGSSSRAGVRRGFRLRDFAELACEPPSPLRGGLRRPLPPSHANSRHSRCTQCTVGRRVDAGCWARAPYRRVPCTWPVLQLTMVYCRRAPSSSLCALSAARRLDGFSGCLLRDLVRL